VPEKPGYRGGFIAHYLVKAIYPPGLTRGMQTGLGVLVLLIAITGYWGFLRRHAGGLTRRWHNGTGAVQRRSPAAGGRGAAAAPPHPVRRR
jgi:uncharacterized protein DUF2784